VFEQIEFPDLEGLQQERAAKFRAAAKAEKREQFVAEKNTAKERRELAELRSYSTMMKVDKMKSNTDNGATADDSAAKNFEDDFM
jgi:hypothetical protein